MLEGSKVNQALLNLFNAVIEQNDITPSAGTEDHSGADTEKIARRLLVDYQVLVLPEAQYALETIKTHVERTYRTAAQLNATFYRHWKDVIEKTRLELFIDQVIHYASTYGTDFTGTAYIPAKEFDLAIDTSLEEIKLTTIGAMGLQLAATKCRTLLSGGTALKRETIEDCLNILNWAKVEISINETKNRETRALLIAELMRNSKAIKGCAPEEFLRAAIFLASNQLLLIKNKKIVHTIVESKIDISKPFQHFGASNLAPIFNRFEPLFLAFKRANSKNKQVINRISKLSKKLHVPLAENPLNMVTHRRVESSELHWLENATVPALLRALNACELAKHEQKGFRYKIRNGKLWISDKKRSADNIETASVNSTLLLSEITKRIGQKIKGKTIYIPEKVEYGLPTSEKQMVGTVPTGTKLTFDPSVNFAVGIFWKSEYNCTDLDLSGSLLGGEHISWNTSYKESGFVYSGDVTRPGPDGATEYLLSQGLPSPKNHDPEEQSLQIGVNCYLGDANHEFDIIVGTGDDVDRQYMMNPKNLMLSAHYKASQKATTIGYILRNQNCSTFILSPGGAGVLRVQSSADRTLEKPSAIAIRHEIEHSLTLNKILKLLGAVVISDPETPNADYDLSLDKINTDLFNLFMAEPED